jgi:hypothetical protein
VILIVAVIDHPVAITVQTETTIDAIDVVAVTDTVKADMIVTIDVMTDAMIEEMMTDVMIEEMMTEERKDAIVATKATMEERIVVVRMMVRNKLDVFSHYYYYPSFFLPFNTVIINKFFFYISTSSFLGQYEIYKSDSLPHVKMERKPSLWVFYFIFLFFYFIFYFFLHLNS